MNEMQPELPVPPEPEPSLADLQTELANVIAAGTGYLPEDDDIIDLLSRLAARLRELEAEVESAGRDATLYENDGGVCSTCGGTGEPTDEGLLLMPPASQCGDCEGTGRDPDTVPDKEQRKSHRHWLDNLPHETQVWGHGGANGESFWTRHGETDNGASFWTSGLNTVSSPTLARICDSFTIEEQPIGDRDPDLVPVMLSRDEVEIMSRAYSSTTIGAACDAALEANPRGES